MLITALSLSLLAQASPAPAAQASPAPYNSDRGAARAEDVASVDSIVQALYDVISGPSGQLREWNRMRNLFLPNARMALVSTPPAGSNTKPQVINLGVEDYIGRSGARMEKDGFFETEIHRVHRRFDRLHSILSTYEGRHKKDEAPFVRGVNSIVLLYDGTRYWIVSVAWEAERADNPLPAEFLK